MTKSTTDILSTPITDNILPTGIIGIVVVLAIATLCIFPFEQQFFVNWVATAFMAATPTQIFLGLLWHNETPKFVNKFSPPVKGLILTAITMIASVVVFSGLLHFVSGGHGITPMLVQYTIMTVIVTLWIIPIWECWPLSKVSSNPTVFGILTLIAVYPIAYLLWSIFFDYSILQTIGFPNYYADIDPKGMFGMWQAITFAVTTSGVVIVHVLFDFWPMNKLCGKAVQPLRGIISTIYVLVLSLLIYNLFVTVFGMDVVDFMIRVPVCMIFGTLLVNNMMQGGLFKELAQPIRGLALIGCCIVAALLMHELYAFASSLHTGQELATGPAGGYTQEIWIASAMLGVTFPIIFVVSGFFNFWPIKRK